MTPPTPVPDAEAAYAALLAQLAGADLDDVHLVGIHSGGAWIAERLARDLKLARPTGTLDISFYRDDFDRIGLHAEMRPTSISFDVSNARLVLVDDVLYTGRTIRGALNVLFDYGRPACVELAVLFDRGGRELPIAARYVGAEGALPESQGLVLERTEAGGFRFVIEQHQKPE